MATAQRRAASGYVFRRPWRPMLRPGFIAPPANAVFLSGNINIQVKNFATTTSTTALAARGQMVIQNRAPGGVILSGRDQVVVKSRAPGGVNLPARGQMVIQSRAPGGANIPGRINLQVKSRAPGGIVLNAAGKGMQVSAQLQGGFALSGRIQVKVSLNAPGGVVISGRDQALVVQGYNNFEARYNIVGPPTPVVRDYWDRDEWGRFFPGSGFHQIR